MRVGVLVVVVGLGIIGGVRNYTTSRTQAAQVADVIAADAHPGDVVAYCPDQLGPSGSRLLRDVPGLVQLTFPDGASPARVDWVDYVHRNQTASTQRFANRVVRLAGPHTIWYVYAYGFNHLQGRCEAVAAALAAARPAEPARAPQRVDRRVRLGVRVHGPDCLRP